MVLGVPARVDDFIDQIGEALGHLLYDSARTGELHQGTGFILDA